MPGRDWPGYARGDSRPNRTNFIGLEFFAFLKGSHSLFELLRLSDELSDYGATARGLAAILTEVVNAADGSFAAYAGMGPVMIVLM